MHETLRHALRHAALYSDGRNYCLVHLPPRAITAAAAVLAENGEPFSAIIVDKDEVTLVLEAASLEDFARRLPDYQAACNYRLLTFDLPLEHTLVGFLSAVSACLAQQGIPIMALSAYQRDHLLIPGAHFDRAIAAIRALQSEAGQP